MSRKNIPKNIRKAVYDKFSGHCAYCGCELEMKDMQVDHIDSVFRAEYYSNEVNDDINNYFPACRQCNFYKSTFDIETFRKNIETKLVAGLEKNFNYRLLRKYGMVDLQFESVKFFFEKHKETIERDKKINLIEKFCVNRTCYPNHKCPLYDYCKRTDSLTDLTDAQLNERVEIIRKQEETT